MIAHVHVQCDRCKKYEEGAAVAYHPGGVQPPDGWNHLVAYPEPIRINQYLPEGPIRLLLCPGCVPVVEQAILAVVGRTH